MPLPFDPATPPVEEAPDWRRRRAPSARRDRRARGDGRRRGPGHRADVEPAPDRCSRTTYARVGAAPTCGRRSSPATSIVDRHRAARRSDRRRRCACSRDLSQAYGDGTVRVTPRQNLRVPLGARATTSRRFYERLAAAGLGARRRRHDRRRHELPGRRVVQARRDAVARPRPRARRAPARTPGARRRARRDSTSRSAAARTAAASITSPAIGFQGSLRKVGDRAGAAVLRDGRRRRRRRHDAVRPDRGQGPGAPHARRRSSGCSRSIATERADEETAAASSAASRSARSRRCSPTSSVTAETATPDDFIDLAETHAFAPEMMDGECSA